MSLTASTTLSLKFITLLLIAIHFTTNIIFAFSTSSSDNNMSTMKRVLVTGGNKGIGKAICEKLLEEHSDVFVWMGSRSKERGEKTVQELIAKWNCLDRIELIELDVGSDDSVEKAADSIQTILQKNNEKLYGIINNAGIMHGTQEEVVNVNYRGTKRIVDAFLPYLQTPKGRIVNIASASGPNFVSNLSQKDPLYKSMSESWTIDGRLDGLQKIADSYQVQNGNNYGFSKALVNAYTLLLARKYPDLIINSVTPGWIQTDMTKGQGAKNPPSRGAVPPVWALLSSELEQVPTGRYYGSDCVRSPMNYYRDPGAKPYDGPDGLEIVEGTSAEKTMSK